MKDFLKTRPLSWSAISSFNYNPEQWYNKYILGKKDPETEAMKFGKAFGKSCEARKPLAPVTLYKDVEYPLNVVFNGIPLIGYIDTYEPHTAFREFKTSNKVWTKNKALSHGQLRQYALMLFIQHKVKPEDLKIHLDCIQTIETGDFKVEFLKPIVVHTTEVKLTMSDILSFGSDIKETVKQMGEYFESRKKSEAFS